METVLITGGGSGIGLASARRLAERMHVVVADLHADRAAAVAAALRQEGRSASSVAVDVRSRASVCRMMDQIEGELGRVDSLLSNAGVGQTDAVVDLSEAAWDLTLDTHVKGAFLVTQAVLPQMCERHAGSIVIMSSDYAVKGMRNGAAYAAAKTALYSLAKSLALEFAQFGIRINAVGPGPIETPLLRRDRPHAEWEAHKAARAAEVPMGRLGQPDEVAALVDFLLGPRSAYITGQIIHPNGGQISW